jgi:NADP-dependent 3-hydroxy acid dehydrogenase YdfG
MSRVLITGASTGVGRATAIELAERGHEVVATARRPEVLEDLPVAERLALDVTDQGSVDAALAAAGDLDGLIANAGETLFGSVEVTPLEEFDRLFQLNTLGALRVAQGVLPGMRERNSGRLVFVSSCAGRVGLPLSSAYCQSKWGLEAIAETLAVELAETDLSVTLFEPGDIAGVCRSKAAVFRDEIATYAPFWEAVEGVISEDGAPLEAIAAGIADLIEDPRPPLRRASDDHIEAILRALDASDRFEAPFDIATVGEPQ